MTTTDQNSKMVVPDWADSPEMREKLSDHLGQQPVAGGFEVMDLNKVTNYSTFFAEWIVKDDTVLVHLFPRAGAEDKWEEGRYLPQCRACRSQVPVDLAQSRKPCPSCGHVGLVYIPGNREMKSETKFPKDVLTKVNTAADAAWMAGVAIEYVKELGAVAVQFQEAELPDKTMLDMLERFFDGLDNQLEGGNGATV
jgi:predicted RNA-binding Zn-ribbon protein involved in translation (DUF1610 family)